MSDGFISGDQLDAMIDGFNSGIAGQPAAHDSAMHRHGWMIGAAEREGAPRLSPAESAEQILKAAKEDFEMKHAKKLPAPSVLRAEIEAGITADQICRKYGVGTRGNVFLYCRTHGIPYPSDYQPMNTPRPAKPAPMYNSQADRLAAGPRPDERRIVIHKPSSIATTHSGASSPLVAISLPRIRCIHGEFNPEASSCQ